METAVRIRAARWADKDDVAALIAEALHPNPLAAWLVPDGEQRRQVLADVVGIWVEHALFFGDVHLTDDLTAAVVGFHRYRPIPPPVNYRIRLADTAGAHADRFDLLDSMLSTRQPTEWSRPTARCPWFGSFSVGPSPNRTGEISPHPALQWSFSGGGCGPSRMDVLVACFADHEGFASTFSHQVYPRGPFRPSWLVEISEFADVVDLQSDPPFAELALSGEEPVDQLVASNGGHDRLEIGDDGSALSLERYPAEAGDQRLPASVSLHGDLKAGPGSVGGVDAGLVLTGHLPDGGLVLRGQGLEHRCLQDPAQPAQAEHVLGEEVVQGYCKIEI